MLRLLKQMKAKQWIMALLCVALILGQIYFDLRLPDYMSDLTVQIKIRAALFRTCCTPALRCWPARSSAR